MYYENCWCVNRCDYCERENDEWKEENEGIFNIKYMLIYRLEERNGDNEI